MPNRTLTPLELASANELLEEVRARLAVLAGEDQELLFAYRRKISKELVYDERSKPMVRRRLKMLKRKQQGGACAVCRDPLPDTYTVLDRLHAIGGYTEANTRLLCQACDRQVQTERSFR